MFYQLSSSCCAAKVAPRVRTASVCGAVWSAAACCRFSPASLLALHRSEYRAPVHGQQAGPACGKSGSKLPHSRAVTACALVYCGGSSILGRGAGLLLGDFRSSNRRAQRSFARASSSADFDGESGGLSG